MTGFVVEGWYGLSAPKGTAPEVVKLLNASVAKAIRAGIFKTIEKPTKVLRSRLARRKTSVVMCLRMQPAGRML